MAAVNDRRENSRTLICVCVCVCKRVCKCAFTTLSHHPIEPGTRSLRAIPSSSDRKNDLRTPIPPPTFLSYQTSNIYIIYVYVCIRIHTHTNTRIISILNASWTRKLFFIFYFFAQTPLEVPPRRLEYSPPIILR